MDTKLVVITDATDAERLHTFPLPDDGEPMLRRAVDPEADNVVCGQCLRIVGKGVTMLDFYQGFTVPAGMRQLLECSCGALLHINARTGERPKSIEEAIHFVTPRTKKPPPSD